MNEMQKNLEQRVLDAVTSLKDADAEGDDYLAEVRVGELEELHRLAVTHNIELPGLADTIQAHTGAIPVVSPGAAL